MPSQPEYPKHINSGELSLLLCYLLHICAVSWIYTLGIKNSRLGDCWCLNSTYPFLVISQVSQSTQNTFHKPILDDIPSQPEYLKHINSVEMSLLMCNLLQIGAASLISTLRIQDFRFGDHWRLNSTYQFLMISQVSQST